MSKSLALKAEFDKFKDNQKLKLLENEQTFWDAWKELKPKDKVDAYIKMMSFFVPRVAAELPGNPNDAKLVLEETKRTATIISGGVEPAEDTDYEDD